MVVRKDLSRTRRFRLALAGEDLLPAAPFPVGRAAAVVCVGGVQGEGAGRPPGQGVCPPDMP